MKVLEIKSNLWKSSFGWLIMNILSYIKNYLLRVLFFKIGKLGRYLSHNNQYADLRKYHNKYKGKKCFIIATGPSLTKEDVSLLKNEYTFGMNSLCLLFEETGWETTFFGIQDSGVYKKLKDRITGLKDTVVLIGDNIYQKEDFKENAIPFPINFLNHFHTYKKLTAKFSKNAYLEVYDGYTITYSLIQIAVYMGFSEIYLLGNDCSYAADPTKQHFIDYGHVDPSAIYATQRILYAYQVAKDESDKSAFTIYNATRGGALELFKRVKLEDVLQKH